MFDLITPRRNKAIIILETESVVPEWLRKMRDRTFKLDSTGQSQWLHFMTVRDSGVCSVLGSAQGWWRGVAPLAARWSTCTWRLGVSSDVNLVPNNPVSKVLFYPRYATGGRG